jgi:hypothetical protein
MSGGHFNSNDYIYYRVHQFADELENEIENNDRDNQYGYSPQYNQEVLNYLKLQIPILRKMSQIMKAIDYLYSGDHGEDSFLIVTQKIENETR